MTAPRLRLVVRPMAEELTTVYRLPESHRPLLRPASRRGGDAYRHPAIRWEPAATRPELAERPVKHRKVARYAPRTCDTCRRAYTPRSGSSRWCDDCRPPKAVRSCARAAKSRHPRYESPEFQASNV